MLRRPLMNCEETVSDRRSQGWAKTYIGLLERVLRRTEQKAVHGFHPNHKAMILVRNFVAVRAEATAGPDAEVVLEGGGGGP